MVSWLVWAGSVEKAPGEGSAFREFCRVCCQGLWVQSIVWRPRLDRSLSSLWSPAQTAVTHTREHLLIARSLFSLIP